MRRSLALAAVLAVACEPGLRVEIRAGPGFDAGAVERLRLNVIYDGSVVLQSTQAASGLPHALTLTRGGSGITGSLTLSVEGLEAQDQVIGRGLATGSLTHPWSEVVVSLSPVCGAVACCVPKTPTVACAEAGRECGSVSDGCTNLLDCGRCDAGTFCGGGGPGRCGTMPCDGGTCASLSLMCGLASDACGNAIDCLDTCVTPRTCGGGGIPNACGCTCDVNCDGVVECSAGCDGRGCGDAGQQCMGGACVCPGGSSPCSDAGIPDAGADGGTDAGMPCALPDGGAGQTSETLCMDGIDNDCDGLTDCADVMSCTGLACTAFGGFCQSSMCRCVNDAGQGTFNPESACSDGRDNDCDGLIDCADPSCANVSCIAAGDAGICCPGNSTCVDATSAQNCGGCGVVCPEGLCLKLIAASTTGYACSCDAGSCAGGPQRCVFSDDYCQCFDAADCGGAVCLSGGLCRPR